MPRSRKPKNKVIKFFPDTYWCIFCQDSKRVELFGESYPCQHCQTPMEEDEKEHYPYEELDEAILLEE